MKDIPRIRFGARLEAMLCNTAQAVDPADSQTIRERNAAMHAARLQAEAERVALEESRRTPVTAAASQPERKLACQECGVMFMARRHCNGKWPATCGTECAIARERKRKRHQRENKRQAELRAMEKSRRAFRRSRQYAMASK